LESGAESRAAPAAADEPSQRRRVRANGCIGNSIELSCGSKNAVKRTRLYYSTFLLLGSHRIDKIDIFYKENAKIDLGSSELFPD
jgi:hypothetical protein